MWRGMDLSCEVIPSDMLSGAVIICADVIEHLPEPEILLHQIIRAFHCGAKRVIMSTPDRVKMHGEAHSGPPPHAPHAMEWTLDEFMRLLERKHLVADCLNVPSFEGDVRLATIMADIVGVE
jgi:hypothetical protein